MAEKKYDGKQITSLLKQIMKDFDLDKEQYEKLELLKSPTFRMKKVWISI